MSLQPDDIDTVEEAGMLDGQPIKLLRTQWRILDDGS